MWKSSLLLLVLCGYCSAGPVGFKKNMAIMPREEEPMIMEPLNSEEMSSTINAASEPEMMMMSTLTLPSNATSIRADITDNFSCQNKSYGYYADVENDCQIFHVCLPVVYADGKENTFRWSFICPEETVFSQESFTCMRREDMTIECEESFKYYDLNRNFGMIEAENNKIPEDTLVSNIPVEEKVKPARIPSAFVKPQEEEVKPILTVEEPQVSAVSNVPMGFASETIKEIEKPIKIQKPNRRKPAFGSNKKNSNSAPLRKAPQSVPTKTNNDLAETAATPEEIEEPLLQPQVQIPLKSLPTRFNKRPLSETTATKIKTQPTKNDNGNTIRIELYNPKRTRPSFLNNRKGIKKPVKSETEQTLALDTKPELEIPTNQEILQTYVPEISASEQDSESAASNTQEVLIKPENFQPVSFPLVEQTSNLEKVQPLEAFEEIPAVLVEVEEPKQTTNPENDNNVLNKPVSLEIQGPAVIDESQVLKQVASESQPSSIEQNSAIKPQDLTPIEELEEIKPENAPETMPASPAMEEQNPMVQEMFPEANAEEHLQSMGGFKPVDPAMAAEAEALIADFINTLMKNDPNSQAVKNEQAAKDVQDSGKQTIESEPIEIIHQQDANDNQTPLESIQQETIQEDPIPEDSSNLVATQEDSVLAGALNEEIPQKDSSLEETRQETTQEESIPSETLTQKASQENSVPIAVENQEPIQEANQESLQEINNEVPTPEEKSPQIAVEKEIVPEDALLEQPKLGEIIAEVNPETPSEKDESLNINVQESESDHLPSDQNESEKIASPEVDQVEVVANQPEQEEEEKEVVSPIVETNPETILETLKRKILEAAATQQAVEIPIQPTQANEEEASEPLTNSEIETQNNASEEEPKETEVSSQAEAAQAIPEENQLPEEPKDISQSSQQAPETEPHQLVSNIEAESDSLPLVLELQPETSLETVDEIKHENNPGEQTVVQDALPQETETQGELVGETNEKSDSTSNDEPTKEQFDTQILENEAPKSDIVLTSIYPNVMYEIPVKVVTNPTEEMQLIQSMASDKSEEPQLNKEPIKAPYTPLSIDDIVELVKEQLEQVPSKTVSEQAKENTGEKEVVPIYHRMPESFVEAMNSMNNEEKSSSQEQIVQSGVPKADQLPAETQSENLDQTQPQTVEEVAESEDADSPSESRSLRSRSMDPRKRRFLFRSDAR